MSKNVYFVGGVYMGCWYVRCLLPLIHNGWSGNYWGLEKKLKPIKVVEQEMMNADIIVFHRANTNWHHRVAMILKGMGKKIVFDNDDTFKLDNYHPFFNLDEKGFEQNKEKLNNVVDNFIRNADLITCSTEYLLKEYKELNPNVVVLPNCVEPDDWDTPLRNDGDKVRIGLVGSVAYAHDFEIIKDIIRDLSKDKRVQIVLFGLAKKTPDNPKIAEIYEKEFAFWESIDIEFTPWTDMVDYFTVLNELRLDIMLIPRRENHFNKAKSNIKFLEAAMCEIPVIASSFKDAPYENDIDGTNGILIKKEEEWLPAINDLIENKEKRRELGRNARQYVLNNYNIKDNAWRWDKVYQELLKKCEQ